MALATIIVISALLLGIVSIGLQMGNKGILFVSQAHKRNVALSAAEAGVYEAIVALQANKGASGKVTGTLSESGATYTYDLDNELTSDCRAVVVSVGDYEGTRRTLRVELEPDSAGFDGLSIGGKVYVFDGSYVNAIASSDNAIPRPGHAHSNFSGSPSSYVAGKFATDTRPVKLHATGSLSAGGSFDPALLRVARGEQTNVTHPSLRLNRDEMISGSFTSLSAASVGTASRTFSANTRITGDVIFQGKVIVPKGVTLHVDGEAQFLGGLSGDGQVVVDRDVMIRTDGNFDPTIKEGIKLYAGESAFMTHPRTKIEDGEVASGEFNEVGDYFAQMPIEASTEISANIPVGAPKGGDFFTWYDDNAGSTDSDFALWYNGDDTDIYPGLSEATKLWLNQSRPIHAQISSWAGSSGP